MILTADVYAKIYKEATRRYNMWCSERSKERRSLSYFTTKYPYKWCEFFDEVKEEYERLVMRPGKWRSGVKYVDPLDGVATWARNDYRKSVAAKKAARKARRTA